MDLEECPLSKEELLELVEEEATMRVSAGFLEQVVGEGVGRNNLLRNPGSGRGKRGQYRWYRGYREDARKPCDETWLSC